MGRIGILKEFFQFLKDNKRWWLIPIIGMLLIFALLIIVADTAGPAAPFIYALF